MTGYYQTPNKMVPLNGREKGEIAEVALVQLMRFNAAAETWPVGQECRDDRYCNVCRVCDQNIWFSTDLKGQPFHYNEAELKALIVAHIRQIHEGIIDE